MAVKMTEQEEKEFIEWCEEQDRIEYARTHKRNKPFVPSPDRERRMKEQQAYLRIRTPEEVAADEN